MPSRPSGADKKQKAEKARGGIAGKRPRGRPGDGAEFFALVHRFHPGPREGPTPCVVAEGRGVRQATARTQIRASMPDAVAPLRKRRLEARRISFRRSHRMIAAPRADCPPDRLRRIIERLHAHHGRDRASARDGGDRPCPGGGGLHRRDRGVPAGDRRRPRYRQRHRVRASAHEHRPRAGKDRLRGGPRRRGDESALGRAGEVRLSGAARVSRHGSQSPLTPAKAGVQSACGSTRKIPRQQAFAPCIAGGLDARLRGHERNIRLGRASAQALQHNSCGDHHSNLIRHRAPASACRPCHDTLLPFDDVARPRHRRRRKLGVATRTQDAPRP